VGVNELLIRTQSICCLSLPLTVHSSNQRPQGLLAH